VSVLYGFGKGLFLVGVYSFVGAKSTPEVSGTHFGLLASMFGMNGFLTSIMSSNTHCTWIVIALSILFLSLGNPEDEEEMIKAVGEEGQGSILVNLGELSKFFPIMLASAFAVAFSYFGFGWLNSQCDSDDQLPDTIFGVTAKVIGIMGPLQLGIFWDKKRF